MAAEYKVKFLFVNAQTIEMTFPAAITVAEAKNKLIESWPAGAVPLTLPAWPHKCAISTPIRHTTRKRLACGYSGRNMPPRLSLCFASHVKRMRVKEDRKRERACHSGSCNFSTECHSECYMNRTERWLRDVCADKEKINGIDELKMMYSGKLLDNSKSFADYKIPTGSQVFT